LILLRFAGLVCSVFYGPYIYLVICLSSLYFAGDIILYFSLFHQSSQGKPDCDFLNQKVWIYIWEILNLLGLLALIVALGWFSWLGFWAMLHVPVHFVVFLILLIIIPIKAYTCFIVFALYTYLKEAYIDSILGKGLEDNEPGLTAGGRRISI